MKEKPMSWWSKLKGGLSAKRQGHELGQDDAPADTGVAASRPQGGDPGHQAGDRHSTTGTTPTETFVGRAGGDDLGYAGQTGAEARAEADEDADPGTDR